MTSLIELAKIQSKAGEALKQSGYDDPDRQRHNCHTVSLAIVKTGLFGPDARVARGFHPKVRGQHSWAVIPGTDRIRSVPLVYDHHAVIIDCTLWSYDEHYELVTVEKNLLDQWVPHGMGSIWTYGPPRKVEITDPLLAIDLDREGLSPEAVEFLDTYGPYDAYAWMRLLNGPMLGWPAKEIIEAAAKDRRLNGFIPIDIKGMLTDLNPSGLYLYQPEVPHSGADREE